MLKKVLFSIVLFCTCFCVSAQIQRKFFGFELAKTTASEIIAELKIDGISYECLDNAIILHHVKFGGYEWGQCFFSFFKSKLYSVAFIYGDDFPDFERLADVLSEKYSKYVQIKEDDERMYLFGDENTSIGLSEYPLPTGTFLIYTDLKLNNRKVQSEISEF